MNVVLVNSIAIVVFVIPPLTYDLTLNLQNWSLDWTVDNDFGRGFRLGPNKGAYSTPPDP